MGPRTQLHCLPMMASNCAPACKSQTSSQALQCRPPLTHAELCSLILSLLPRLTLPPSPRPSLCSQTIPSSSLVYVLFPLPGTFLLYICARLTHSYIPVFAQLAAFCPFWNLSLSSISLYFIDSTYHYQKIIIDLFLHIVNILHWNVGPVRVGTFCVLITDAGPRLSTKKAPGTHLLAKRMNDPHNSCYLSSSYSVPGTGLGASWASFCLSQ